MRHFRVSISGFAVLALAGLMTGCVHPDLTWSLYPLPDDNDKPTFEESLPGNWYLKGEDSAGSIEIQRSGEKGYILYTRDADGDVDEGETRHFDIVRIGTEYFMNLSKPEQEITGYMFAKVSLAEDKWTLALVNHDWLARKASEEKWLPYVERPGGDLLITASSDQLQHFFRAHSFDRDAYIDPTVWVRDRQTGDPEIADGRP